MKPGEGAAHLRKLRKHSPLRTDVTFPEEEHVAHAVAKALDDLWSCNGIHPARIAGLALEEANSHQAAAVCFALAEGDLSVEKLREILAIRNHIEVTG